MDKDSLRKHMLKMRSGLPAEAKKEKEKTLRAALFESAEWKNAPAIAIFVAFRDELDTSEIIEQAWREGKEVFAPKVKNLKDRKMDFIKIGCREDLHNGYMGIPEPVSDQAAKISPDVLILLPGLAFDRKGWRLGYGGGFYDTFLGDMSRRPTCIGLCFQEQIVEEVPHEQYDVPIDGICSDAGLERIG